ncbi:MAG: hypothetical protein ACTFAK_01225 [Candidatus Electronema sp. VV]
MCDDFLYHHNVLTHHFLFYHYPVTLAAPPRLLYSSISIFNSLSFNKVIPFPLP